MRTENRKATFSIHADVLGAVDEAVARGAAPSKNAFVERALVHELRELRRQERKSRWQAAAHDPAFLRDLQEVEEAFRTADAETARSIG